MRNTWHYNYADHRAQIVHHATTLQTPFVVFVDATSTSIIRIVIACVSEKMRNDYIELLSSIERNYLRWVYSSNSNALQNIPQFSDKVLGFCTDMHTLQLTLNLWHTINRLHKQLNESPFPPIKKINPALVTYWNHSKGGVDVETKEKANNNASYQHLPVVARLYDLLLIEALINAGKLFKWTQLEFHLNSFTSSDSLKSHYNRNSLNDILKNMCQLFRNRSESIRNSVPMQHVNSCSNIASSSLPSEVTFNVTAQNYTSQASVLHRTTGNHIYSTSMSRIKCIVCKLKTTTSFCAKCNVHACLTLPGICKSATEKLSCYERYHDPDTASLVRPHSDAVDNINNLNEENEDEECKDEPDNETNGPSRCYVKNKKRRHI